jgi:DNA-binding winged helix-turn-helix (wHTH) protein
VDHEPDRARHEPSWRIHLVTADAPLAERIRYHFKNRTDLELVTSEELLPVTEADVFIIPVQMLAGLETARKPVLFPDGFAFHTSGGFPDVEVLPIIAYGNISQMNGAFLTGVYDYLTDPWTPDELVLRLDRLLRRWQRQFQFEWGNLSLKGNVLTSSERKAFVSHQEAKILRLMLKNRGRVVSRESLFYVLWGKPPENPSRVVDVHISSLNRKLRAVVPDLSDQRLIVSVRKIGYTIP